LLRSDDLYLICFSIINAAAMLKKALKKYTFENREEIILRDYLALERTRLANERTLFAYLRTSLYLIMAGIGFHQLEGLDNIKWMGTPSLVLSGLLLLLGIARYIRMNRRIRRFYINPMKEKGFEET
jgi:putative membrane protein